MNLILPAWAQLDGRPSQPSAPQAEFMRACQKHTNTYFLGGVGSGKSWAGAWAFLLWILRNRVEMQRLGRRGPLLYIVGCPTYQLIDAGPWRHLLSILDEIQILNGLSLIRGKPAKTHPRQIRLITGDTITFISTDSGRYAGANAAGCWLDEAEVSEDPVGSYQLLNNRVRDARAPCLFTLVTSTPGDEGRGLLPLWQERMAANDGSYALVQADVRTNPAMAATGYYERLKATMSKREVEAKLHGRPQPPTGTIYGSEFSAANIDTKWKWTGRPAKDREYCLAIDWPGHASCLLIEHDPATSTDVVFDEMHTDGQSDADFLSDVLALLAKWNLDRRDVRLWCDAQPPSALTLALSSRYFRGRCSYRRQTADIKREGIEIVRWRLAPAEGQPLLMFASRLQQSGYQRGILRSLANYVWQERRVGGQIVQVDRVHQDHWASHACDALRYYASHRYLGRRRRELGRAAA